MKITKQQLKQIIKEELSAQELTHAKELLAQGLMTQQEYEELLDPQKKADRDASMRALYDAPTRAPTTAENRGGALHTNSTGMSNPPTEKAQLATVAEALQPLVTQLQTLLKQIGAVL
jgi:hypothetical protein